MWLSPGDITEPRTACLYTKQAATIEEMGLPVLVVLPATKCCASFWLKGVYRYVCSSAIVHPLQALYTEKIRVHPTIELHTCAYTIVHGSAGYGTRISIGFFVMREPQDVLKLSYCLQFVKHLHGLSPCISRRRWTRHHSRRRLWGIRRHRRARVHRRILFADRGWWVLSRLLFGTYTTRMQNVCCG